MTCEHCGQATTKSPLLNDTELRQALGIGVTKFYELKKAGKFRIFEVSRPLGQRRYARAKVEQFAAGEAMAVLGGRR